MSFNRRNFMIGAAATAAGVAIAKSLTFSPANAAAPQGKTQAPGFYRTKVGGIEVLSLLDGSMVLGDDLMLNTNAETLAEAKEKNFIPAGKEFPAYVNGFVINTGKKVTLVDTGAKGYAPTLGNLMLNLKAAGISADQVDEVVLTHAHPDHTNGLLDTNGKPVFARAKIRLSAEEMDFWFDPAKAAAMPQKKQLLDFAARNLTPYKQSGQIETFKLGSDLGGGVSSVSLPGHTPGHSGVRISDGSDQLLIWADIVHVAAVQFEHPQAGIGFDTDAEQARVTRRKIMDEVSADRIRIAGSHLAFPAIGHVVKRGQGYEFLPQSWEAVV